MRTWILGIFLALAGLVLVVGLWLLGYHLSGKWAFHRWKAERIAMGDHLDWKDLVPPPVEPSQNFAEAPLIKGAILGKGPADGRFKALSLKEEASKSLGNWQEGRRDDLGAVLRAYDTQDLQTVFKPLESIIRELDQASRRPSCRMPIAYEDGEIPALLGFRAAVRTLRVRALANLHAGHSDLALEDLQTCLRIADHLKTEPTLISALLRAAILNTSLQVAWEGLEDRLWMPVHLETLQVELSKIDLLASSKIGWQGERQGFIQSMVAAAENRPMPNAMADLNLGRIPPGALGRGWMYRNLTVWCQFMSSVVDVQDPGAHRVYPARQLDPETYVKQMRFRKDLILAQIAIPALAGQTVRFARTQALVDEGMVVCALERYRLEKGQYPERLADLMPTFLQAAPHDLVTGGPLVYSRKGENFKLYQVGWDGVDHDGTPGWTGEGAQRKVDPAKGDWVWPHATP
jgi:hypothetical protein